MWTHTHTLCANMHVSSKMCQSRLLPPMLQPMCKHKRVSLYCHKRSACTVGLQVALCRQCCARCQACLLADRHPTAQQTHRGMATGKQPCNSHRRPDRDPCCSLLRAQSALQTVCCVLSPQPARTITLLCCPACRLLVLLCCRQVDMLRQNLFGSYDDFGKKYCLLPNSPAGGGSSGGGGRGWRPKYQGSNPATAGELHRLLLANVMVRRTKGQAGVGLPEKTRLKVRASVLLCWHMHGLRLVCWHD